MENGGLNVLSLFDGMSGGRIALREAGIKVNKYFASEIDKYAIAQTQLNFPDTVQLGDVTNWKEWDINWGEIDLLLAGSPCQGFSFAGKQLAFDDPRSKLFFVFIKILNHIKSLNPNVLFMLENVNMKKEHMRIISEYCGVFPVNINSNLVSAQNRDRWYWTNIRTKKIGLFGELHSDIPQPEDKGIFLRDILEEEVDERYFLSDKVVKNMLEHKERNKEKGNGFGAVFHKPENKMGCLKVGGTGIDDLVCVAMRGREASCLTPKRTEYGKSIRKAYEEGKIEEQRKNMQRLEPRTDGRTNCLTSVQKDNLILLPAIYQRPRGENKGGIITDKTPTLTSNAWQQNNLVVSGTFRTHKDDFGFREIKSGKAATIPARAREDGSGQNVCKINNRIRRLTPTECSRLQTIPDWYKWECSDTQRYKMLGNGWTVDVIAHIMSFIYE